MRTKIVHEDEHIIVCHKPAGLATQSAVSTSVDVASELKNYVKGGYIGMIHRLDQPVEGLLVFAKDKKTASVLSESLQKHSLRKSYLALVSGFFSEKKGCFRDRLYQDKKNNRSMAVTQADGDQWRQGKDAILNYEVVRESLVDAGEKVSLIRIELETGRHHQIRVQCAAHGHPLIGDEKYGTDLSRKLTEALGRNSLCLLADTLVIPDVCGEREKVFRLDCPF